MSEATSGVNGVDEGSAQATRMHGPASRAPNTTGLYARCRVCNGQWQIKDPDEGDAQHCPWCGAPRRAIDVLGEKGDFGGATLIGGASVGE